MGEGAACEVLEAADRIRNRGVVRGYANCGDIARWRIDYKQTNSYFQIANSTSVIWDIVWIVSSCVAKCCLFVVLGCWVTVGNYGGLAK